jgi:hypothetical protein
VAISSIKVFRLSAFATLKGPLMHQQNAVLRVFIRCHIGKILAKQGQ